MTDHDTPPEFRELRERAARLPKSIEPPRDLWPEIETRIAGTLPGKREKGNGKRWAPWLLLPLAAAAILAVVLLGRRGWGDRRGTWEVMRVAGLPLVGSSPLGATGALQVGQWLETDDSSRAVILVGDIGHVEVKPDTRIRLVRALRDDHRLALERGEIYAKVDAPPRLFFVDTPAGTAVDLGCAYTLAVDSSGNGTIHVTGGYVEFDWGGRRSVVPLGFRADTRRAFGPGTPYAADAPEALRQALAAFDFANGGAAAVRRALAAARSEDAVSLWHLLERVDPALRRTVYDRLASLVPPPGGVTPEGALRLDRTMLQTYWNTIRRIAWRKAILQGIRDIDPRTGTAR
jgi:FecR protein